MSKGKLAGFLVLGCGAVLGILIGGQTVLGLVAVCLVVGFGLFFGAEARGLAGPNAVAKARILVLLKEVHARPQRKGKFQEIDESDDSVLEFEVFVSCWFLNESDVAMQLSEEVQLSVRTSDGSVAVAQRIRGDLDKWRLGSLVRDEWDTDIVRTRQEEMRELSLQKPLECGVPRHGWAHFRFDNVSPSGLKKGELRLSVNDVSSNVHEGMATRPVRHVPGRVWPYVAKGASATQSVNN